jgi:hypothetical protein
MRNLHLSFFPSLPIKPFKCEELVHNHGDFSTYNVIVDPVTLKVKAILNWEYAGFYPEQFEGKFFKRVGPLVALDGEENDEVRLLDL